MVVALDVAEEPAEAGAQGQVLLHPAHRRADPLCGLVGADLIVLSLEKHETHSFLLKKVRSDGVMKRKLVTSFLSFFSAFYHMYSNG